MTAYVKLLLKPDWKTVCDGLKRHPGETINCKFPDQPMKLCTGSCVHCYAGETQADALLVAEFMRREHGYGGAPGVIAVECFPSGEMITDGTKCGFRTVALGTAELELPDIPIAARQRTAVVIAQRVAGDKYPEWSAWAVRWLSRKDVSDHCGARDVCVSLEKSGAFDRLCLEQAVLWFTCRVTIRYCAAPTSVSGAAHVQPIPDLAAVIRESIAAEAAL